MKLTYIKASIIILFSIFFGNMTTLHAQKSIKINRTTESIKIDGEPSEAIWQKHLETREFTQRSPDNGKPSKRTSQIGLLYDDSYLYVLGIFSVENSTEINNQLTERDDPGNSDYFGIQMDPFGEAREGYDFTVTAANVQLDSKLTNTGNYDNFNVVWDSEVTLHDNNWVVEVRIPFNSIRFPKDALDNFKINFQRFSSKLNEDSFWSPIDPNQNGYMNQFGTVTNFKSINPPLNLSLLPFVSVVHEKSVDGETKTTLNGGMDLKYVYDNAYTLDVSLIPDFSQAQSDNQILNLSPFEVQFNENRQFFVEGTELFDKGGYLYTRRIGGRPINSDNIQISEEEEIIENPVSTNILNLIKFSGKSKSGLSIGVLNGITAKSEATVRNTETNEQRSVITNPITNYNSLVLDQALKNNGSLTLINNSVLRNGSDYDANLTALLYRYYSKNRTYSAYFKKGISQQYFENDRNEIGHEYYAYAGKVSGKWTGGFSYYLIDDKWDINDFGFNARNNQSRWRGDVSYAENKPNNTFSNYQLFVLGEHYYYHSLQQKENANYILGFNGTLKKSQATIFADVTYSEKGKNFYEARIKDRHFNKPAKFQSFLEYQTNANKNLSFSGYAIFVNHFNSEIYKDDFIAGYGIRARAGQHLYAYFSQGFENLTKSAGFIAMENDAIVFGQRSINVLSNVFTLNYAVNSKLNFNLRARHYWIQVAYSKQFQLQENGVLTESNYDLNVDDFDDNFNQFNIDVLGTWQFAPASELSLSYKLGANYFNDDIRSSYLDNLEKTLGENTSSTISLKMTYFLDANILRKR